MLLQFGDYVFQGLKLPQSWDIGFETVYAQIPIIGGKPVVQKTGEKLVEQVLTVLFSDEFCNPARELEALQLYRRNGNVHYLTGGDGQNYGRYVITEISQVNERANDSTGYISAISAVIKLMEYNTTASTVKPEGVALASNKITPVVPKPASLFQAADLQLALTAGKTDVKNVGSLAKSLTVNYNKIVSLCTSAKAAFTSANAKVQQTKKIIDRATDLQLAIQNTSNAIEDVKAAAQIENLDDLLAANTVLERAMYNMDAAGAPVAAFIGSREAGI